MTCSSSVGLVIHCNITPRHSSKVSSEDKLSVVILMSGDMVGHTGDASPVSPAVATPLDVNDPSATRCRKNMLTGSLSATRHCRVYTQAIIISLHRRGKSQTPADDTISDGMNCETWARSVNTGVIFDTRAHGP